MWRRLHGRRQGLAAKRQFWRTSANSDIFPWDVPLKIVPSWLAYAKLSKAMPRQNVKRTKRESGNSTNHLVHVLMVRTSLKTMKKNQMMRKRKMKNQLMKSKIQAAKILKIWSQKIAVLRLAARSTENNNSFVNSNVQKEPTSWAKMVSSKLMNPHDALNESTWRAKSKFR